MTGSKFRLLFVLALVLMTTSARAGVVPTIDLSYGTGTITQDDIACWYASGVRHFIVRVSQEEAQNADGTSWRDITQNQLYELWYWNKTETGKRVTRDGYLYIYWEDPYLGPPKEQVENAILTIHDYGVKRLWLDLELTGSGGNVPPVYPDDVKDLLQGAFKGCSEHPKDTNHPLGFPCGIYTALGWWHEQMRDHGYNTAFRGQPLWHARYDGDPALSTWWSKQSAECPKCPHRFGGWVRPVGKQYVENDKSCNGKTVDLSSMYKPLNAKPWKPKIYRPASGAIFGNSETVVLHCKWIPYATRYRFQIQLKDQYGAWKVYKTYTISGKNRIWKFTSSEREPNSEYRLRVQAKNHKGWGKWSDYRTFIVGSLCAPGDPCPEGVISTPAGGAE